MREIKIRMWDDGELDDIGKMKYGNMELFDDMLGFRFPHFSNTVESVNDLKIMQYTGLNDKNGKEIYEGDIVSTQEYYRGVTRNCIISFHKGRWILNFINLSKFVPLFGRLYEKVEDGIRLNESIEVIGNIYDNPELLKEE